jgi:hypothetical protein
MTIDYITGGPTRTSGDETAGTARSGTRALTVAAGAVLVAGPVLWAAGMFTSPQATSMSDVDYVASLVRNTTMTQVSALFLHYGNLLLGLGVLAAPFLVRGRKGRGLTTVGALLAALGFTNMSGMLLSDWWNASAGAHLTLHQAAAVFAGFKDSTLLWPWDATEMFSLLGPVLLLAGLARAGVLGWWTIGLLVAGVAGLMFIPVSVPQLTALAVLVGFSPFALIGGRLLQRARLSRG